MGRETRPHGKENQGKGPDGPHERDDEDEDEDEDENLDVVADRILANLNQFKQYAIVQFQSKNFTESAFKRIGARFEGISREMKNYNYYFEQAAEKMNNKTRVRELMEKNDLMKKISREIRKMGEEAENELPRHKNRRETRPHGKENQGKGPDGPHEKDDEDEDEDENLDVVADRILANLNQFKQYAIVQFQSKNFTESAFKRIEARFEDISREMKNYNYYFEQAAEKMNNKTRVNELMEKTHLTKKISREIKKMGEEAENELPRYKNRRETRPHGKENQ